MQALESMRKRLATAEDLSSVVRIMKALAAASIRQYEQAVSSLGFYSATVEQGLRILLGGTRHDWRRRMPPSDQTMGLVVFGSDMGMCGSFNEQVVRATTEYLEANGVDAGSCSFLVLGTRVADRLAALGCGRIERFSLPSSVQGISRAVGEVVMGLQRLIDERHLHRVSVIHHASHSELERVRIVPLLPLDEEWLRGVAAKPWPSRCLPMYTMPPERLFSRLVREYLFVSLYRACAHSSASEHAARLATMQAAEKNIEEHTSRLRNRFFQQRQEAITAELLDIVASYAPDGS